jgi:hypothetical protein
VCRLQVGILSTLTSIHPKVHIHVLDSWVGYTALSIEHWALFTIYRSFSTALSSSSSPARPSWIPTYLHTMRYHTAMILMVNPQKTWMAGYLHSVNLYNPMTNSSETGLDQSVWWYTWKCSAAVAEIDKTKKKPPSHPARRPRNLLYGKGP